MSAEREQRARDWIARSLEFHDASSAVGNVLAQDSLDGLDRERLLEAARDNRESELVDVIHRHIERERLLEAELAAAIGNKGCCLDESCLAARERDAHREALRMIDAMLTTAAFDNIPVGEVPKLHARTIARDALAAAEAPQ